MYPLTDSEREVLKTLVGMALENRFSALRELTDETREQLYVIFAKLAGGLEAEDSVRASEPDPERASAPQAKNELRPLTPTDRFFGSRKKE